MDEDGDRRRKKTLIQTIFRIGLMAIPIFLYGRYVYNTFRPCPQLKSIESGYRYANNNVYHSIRQKILETLIEKCCNQVITKRNVNFEAAKRMAQQHPCDRFDRLERSRKSSYTADDQVDAKFVNQRQKNRGKMKRTKPDPCNAHYDQETRSKRLPPDQKNELPQTEAAKLNRETVKPSERTRTNQFQKNDNYKDTKDDGSAREDTQDSSSLITQPLTGRENTERSSSKDIVAECKKFLEEELMDHKESKQPPAGIGSSKTTDEHQVIACEEKIRNLSKNKQRPRKTKRSSSKPRKFTCLEPLPFEQNDEILTRPVCNKFKESKQHSSQSNMDECMKELESQTENEKRDDSTITIPPEVLDRLFKSYNESYQRLAEKLDPKNDKISSATTDAEPCDEHFHSRDPDTPYIVKNYACNKQKTAESEVHTPNESDPCKGISGSEESIVLEVDDGDSRESKLPVRTAKAETLRDEFWHSGEPPQGLIRGCKTPRKNTR